MSAAVYSAKVRDQSAHILWGEAELLDRCADLIVGTHMTATEAGDYLRELAAMYRTAASDATRGRDEVTDV